MGFKAFKAAGLAGILAALSMTSAHAAFVDVYNQNFDSNLGAEWTGFTTISGVQSLPSPFSGNFLQGYDGASKSTLTLTGIGPHTQLDINFDLAFLDSWDSTDGVVNASPDYFNVDVNGVNIFHVTSANASGTITYSGGTGLGSPAGGCNAYGFNGAFCDRAFDVSSDGTLTFANSTSSIVIDFYPSGSGWQGGADESWGIDNLNVQADVIRQPTNDVPEPGTLFLLGSGLAGLLFGRRRKDS